MCSHVDAAILSWLVFLSNAQQEARMSSSKPGISAMLSTNVMVKDRDASSLACMLVTQYSLQGPFGSGFGVLIQMAHLT